MGISKDGERSGCPQTSRTVGNIKKSSTVVNEVKSVSQTEFKYMVKNGFQKCFNELLMPWQKCTVAQESCFEGGCVSTT
ncbi:hypothetical protein TNCV_2407341 [Trichonephila clavipes]|nr:hypothetical protein TNCV_2407341 [Trichonephila clavipes]